MKPTRPHASLLPAPLLSAALLLVALLPGQQPAHAALPAGYVFSSITDGIPADSDYRAEVAAQQFSVATATNNSGQMFGFRLTTDGMIRGFSIAFADNPKVTALDTDNFFALSASEPVCWWIFCSTEYAFGARLIDGTSAVTAFVNTPTDSSARPGSLPFLEYPGNFVDENKNGVVASTQFNSSGQFGVLFHAGGQVLLDDVPWLIAINDLTEPLILGYDGDDGACLVFGDDCMPDPVDCDDDDRHHGNGADTGQGHEEHGNGHGYGHHHCDDDHGSGPRGEDDDDDDARAAARSRRTLMLPGYPAPDYPAPQARHARTASPPAGTGALLIRLLADGSTVRYRFPATAVAGDSSYAVSDVFPLAMNDNRAILRGTVTVGDTVHDKRLLSCVLNPAALDAGADGTVDCTGGMTVIGGVAGSVRVGTVLGFALNNAGVLAGNYGFNAAGIGAPFLLDVTALTPVPEPLGNLAAGHDGWELNTLTDQNQSGKLVGYGYKNCGAQPEAFFLNSSASAPAGLRFARSGFESPAWQQPGRNITVNPELTGGSGSYQLRVLVKTPAAADWTLVSDWTSNTPVYQARGIRGELCLRVQARDAAAPDVVREQVVRYLVSREQGDRAASESGGDPAPVAAEPDDSTGFADLLGSTGGLYLLALTTLLLRRRRPAA